MWTSRRVGRTIAAFLAAAAAVLGASAAQAAPPVVSFTAPASGATLAGTASVSANASDADGIAAVEFRVDGTLIVRDTGAPFSLAWNTTSVANGSRKLAAAAFDTKGNRTTVTRTVNVANTADTTAPTVAFSAPAAGATVVGTIAITATASDASGVASVRFAVDGQTLSTDTASPYAHGAWDSRTVANGSRTLSLVATDTRGNTRTVTRAVTVSNTPPDATGPTLALTAPAAGATLTGAVAISATASDASGVASVRFAVDGATLSTDPDAPYTHGGWDTTTVANGARTLSAIATDTRGNTTTVTRSVTVFNPVPDTTGPTLAVTAPAAGASLSGAVTITATASDASGVASVRFAVDGQTLSTDTTSPYTHGGWDTTTVANGARTLSLLATDTRGNTTTVTRSVTVANPVPDTTGPTLAFTAPAAGATLSGAVTISATASDASGVASVSFAVDGHTLSTDPDAPYTHGGWDTTSAGNGTRTLALTATDTRGNSTTVTRSVSVDNTPPDAEGPDLEITAPAQGAELSGPVDITATASDASGVASVRFAVDGEVLSTDTTSPYAHVAWDPAGPPEGPRAITVTATDTLGNPTVRTRSVTFAAPPPDLDAPDVGLTAPADGATVSGTLDIRASASDPGGVAAVRFLVDGEELSADATAPYVHGAWDTTALADGEHLVEAVASDAAGNSATAAATVTVERPPPDLAGPDLDVTVPSEGATVTGVVQIAADATDPSGIAGVEFTADGSPLGSDDSAPYSHPWDTTALEPGSHAIEVAATDTLGNRTVVGRTVTVEPTPAPPPAAGPLPGTVVMRGDFETGNLTQFRTVQRAATDRLQVVASPVAEGAWAGRFEVRKGDTAASGTRTEVIAGPDVGEGDERWYEWRTMFAPDYPTITGGYQIVAQWHATVGNSQPMIVVFVSGDDVGFKTVESGADLKPSASVVRWRGALDRGRWHTFRVRVRWSTDRAVGLVELYHDGLRAVAPTPMATLIPGHDAYFKMGIYRSPAHEPPAVVHHDGLIMTAVG